MITPEPAAWGTDRVGQVQVLLVDDHEEVRSMLRVALGMRPRLRIAGEAGSIADAVDMAGMLRPDAIVLDLVLPDSDEPRATFIAMRQGAPATSELVIYSAFESEREWYERQGVPFFGKASDSVSALADFLESTTPA
jgi:DNA-binding NarL/FixJ family response regulator